VGRIHQFRSPPQVLASPLLSHVEPRGEAVRDVCRRTPGLDVRLLPAWALVVRRLHDADLSGWMSLLTVLPYAGAILQIVFGMLPPKPLGERFDRR